MYTRLVHLELTSQHVECDSEELRHRVQAVVEMAAATMKPLSQTFIGQGAEQVKSEPVEA